MNDWPPNNKHRFKRTKRSFALGFLLLLGGCVALAKLPTPTETTVTSNIPTPTTVIPAGARHLDPTQARPGLIATTTAGAPTTTRVVEEDGPLMVINGREVIYLKRTPLIMQLLWVATKGQG